MGPRKVVNKMGGFYPKSKDTDLGELLRAYCLVNGLMTVRQIKYSKCKGRLEEGRCKVFAVGGKIATIMKVPPSCRASKTGQD